MHTCICLHSILNVSVSFKDNIVYNDIKSQISKFADDACKTTTAVETKATAIDDSERKDQKELSEFQSKVFAFLNEKFQNLTSHITAKCQEFRIKLIHFKKGLRTPKLKLLD